MSDDLVAKLRDAHSFMGDPLLNEAAAEIKRLREALCNVREAIVNADPNVLTCTLWMPQVMSETVVDYIDAALASLAAPSKGEKK